MSFISPSVPAAAATVSATPTVARRLLSAARSWRLSLGAVAWMGLFAGLVIGGASPVQAQGFDPDAQAYIDRVEAADDAPLEPGVREAINAFVVGAKQDGIWNAIKASAILAGAVGNAC